MTDEIPWRADAELTERAADGRNTVLSTGTVREMVKAGAQVPAERDVRITLTDPAAAAAHGVIDAAMLRRYAGLILSGEVH